MFWAGGRPHEGDKNTQKKLQLNLVAAARSSDFGHSAWHALRMPYLSAAACCMLP